MLKTVSTTVIADNSLPRPVISTFEECVGLVLLGTSVCRNTVILNFGSKFVVIEADMDEDNTPIMEERDGYSTVKGCATEFDEILMDFGPRRFVEAGICTQEHADALEKAEHEKWAKLNEQREREHLAELKAKYEYMPVA